jgi:alpha-amylase
MSVLLQGFFFDVKSASTTDWWDHLAGQAQHLGKAGFTAIWLPPPYKGASGGVSNGCDPFDDYDLGFKDQRGTVPTHYGTRQRLQRCAAMMRANGIDVYVDLVENQREGDDGHFNFVYADAFGNKQSGRFPNLVLGAADGGATFWSAALDGLWSGTLAICGFAAVAGAARLTRYLCFA